MPLDIAGLREIFLKPKKATNAALKVAASCETKKTPAKREAAARQEIDALAIVEAYLERVAIAQIDGQCSEWEAQQIATEQIRGNYVCYMRMQKE